MGDQKNICLALFRLVVFEQPDWIELDKFFTVDPLSFSDTAGRTDKHKAIQSCPSLQAKTISWEFSVSPGNMDGFYDQQVPFMVPPSVSIHPLTVFNLVVYKLELGQRKSTQVNWLLF